MAATARGAVCLSFCSISSDSGVQHLTRRRTLRPLCSYRCDLERTLHRLVLLAKLPHPLGLCPFLKCLNHLR
jgi:hypothetical protein